MSKHAAALQMAMAAASKSLGYALDVYKTIYEKIKKRLIMDNLRGIDNLV